MDIVLEIFDKFLFDRLYATILPRSPLFSGKHVSGNSTSTFSSVRESPKAVLASSQFFQLEPSPYAFLSAWPRNYIWRQGLSLYLITW